MTKPRLLCPVRRRIRILSMALTAVLVGALGCAGTAGTGGAGIGTVTGDSLPQLSPETLALLRPGPPQPYAGAYLFAYVSRRARSVTVAGTFNGWIPTANSLQRRALAPSPGAAAVPDSLWYALVPVPRGRHRYKFLVDGSRWIPDPANPDRTSDGSGGVASGLVVR